MHIAGGAGALLLAPSLAESTCARRLAPLGLELADLPGCAISWFGPLGWDGSRRGGEAVVQAMSGLMALNGRDAGQPQRIGLPVASVAAGLLAAQATLANLVGEARGRPARPVSTSVLQAGLLACSHYVAAATSGEDRWPMTPAAEPGPPFTSSDGRHFEIETLDPEAWRSFWHHLGAGAADLGQAWTRFRLRYFEGACSLPPGLRSATEARSMDELEAAARSHGVSLCELRSYDQVLGDVADAEAHPGFGPLGPRLGRRPPWPAAGDLPLAGMTLVESTTRMQGPLAGLLVQMLGARVLKVEPPGGDVGRSMVPTAGGVGTFFSCWNRGKQTIELDLATPSGRDELVDLVSAADAFLHNWRPGRARTWSLAPEDLVRHNPGLVCVEASGWGARPDRDHLLGTDFLVQAFAGMGDGLSPSGRPPRTSRVLLTDFMGALVTCEGILAGLYLREREGAARSVGTSLLAGAGAIQAEVLDAIRAGSELSRIRGRPVWGPLDLPVRTLDGDLVVGDLDGDALGRLCVECGVQPPGWDRQVASRVPGLAEVAGLAEVEALVAASLAGGEAAGWEARLVDAGIPAAVVRQDLAGLVADPDLGALFEPVGGSARAPSSPWAFLR